MGNIFAKFGVATTRSREKAFNHALHLNDTLLQTLRGLGLDHKHLFALHQIFLVMDRDKSGEINMMEFFDYIDLKRSRFSEKAFSVMDRNGSGEVDFIEFVLAVWNYCSFNHTSLVRFAFDLYDVDGSGEIEHDEVERCVREIWGSAWETNPNAHKIVEKLDIIMAGTPNNRLSPSLFQEFAARHPMLLFPAFELQMEIQRKVLGKRFWSRATEKRGSINVTALNWHHVKEVTLISRQTSSNLLTSMENDLSRQLQTKTTEMASSWYGRGSGFRPFSPKRTLASGTSTAAATDEDNGSKPLPELKRAMTPAKKEMRRQSAPAAPHSVSTTQSPKTMEATHIKVVSPKHTPQERVRLSSDAGLSRSTQ
ncbi:hypothetical protein PRNP1_003557 [Phytophthora ramorum]